MNNEEFTESLTELEKPLIKKYCEILSSCVFALAEHRGKILEVGSGWGLFTRSAMMASDGFDVITIDKIPPESLPEFNKNTAGFEERIRRNTGSSKDIIPQLDNEYFDFVFIDGDHGYEGALSDARLAWDKLHIDGYMLFDDCLHKNNWKVNENLEPQGYEFDYGTTRAAWDFMQEKGIVDAELFNVGHGLIQKKK